MSNYEKTQEEVKKLAEDIEKEFGHIKQVSKELIIEAIVRKTVELPFLEELKTELLNNDGFEYPIRTPSGAKKFSEAIVDVGSMQFWKNRITNYKGNKFKIL